MPDSLLTDADARRLLEQVCAPRGGARRFAARAGLSACFVSLMLSGRRSINEAAAEALGLRPVRGFVRVETQP